MKISAAHATRQNIDWVMEITGQSREYIEKELDRTEEEGVVCIIYSPSFYDDL